MIAFFVTLLVMVLTVSVIYLYFKSIDVYDIVEATLIFGTIPCFIILAVSLFINFNKNEIYEKTLDVKVIHMQMNTSPENSNYATNRVVLLDNDGNTFEANVNPQIILNINDIISVDVSKADTIMEVYPILKTTE